MFLVRPVYIHACLDDGRWMMLARLASDDILDAGNGIPNRAAGPWLCGGRAVSAALAPMPHNGLSP